MTFSLNNFIVIVGVLLVNTAICIDDFDENEIVEYDDIIDEDTITENGCEFIPLKSHHGYSYKCGEHYSPNYNRGKLIIKNKGTDKEEILYKGDCVTKFYNGLTQNVCHHVYTADNYQFNFTRTFVITPQSLTPVLKSLVGK